MMLYMKTKNTNTYYVQPFSKNRKNISLLLDEAKRKHTVYALLELDITQAKQLIHHQKKTGVDISFTAWLMKCIAHAASQHPQLNSYRKGRRKTVVFNEIDIPLTIEKTICGETRPVVCLIRNVQEKTIETITHEIRRAQQQKTEKNTQIIGIEKKAIQRVALSAPACIQKTLLVFLRRKPLLKKKYMGTIGVTSIGMLGTFPGWAVPLGGSLTTLVAIGGIRKKPGVVNDSISIREFLHVTIAVDHDLIDGGPLARFVNCFSNAVEQACFLQ